MRTNDEIIKIVSDLKEEKGWSVNELARRLDIAKSSMSRYFNKTRGFPINKVCDFARVLGVTPEYLLGFDLQQKTEQKSESTTLTDLAPTDGKEIPKMLYDMLDRLNRDSYDSDVAYEIMKSSLENTLRTSKILAKNRTFKGY